MVTTPERSDPRPFNWTRVLAQWLAVVGPPVAVFAQQQLAYSLVAPSCANQARLLLHVPTLLMLLAIGIAAGYSWREWNRGESRSKSGNGMKPGPSRFFATLGLTMSGMAVVVLVAQWLPTLFVQPCLR